MDALSLRRFAPAPSQREPFSKTSSWCCYNILPLKTLPLGGLSNSHKNANSLIYSLKTFGAFCVGKEILCIFAEKAMLVCVAK